ncbi:MAG TPA: hypothetical protein VK919_12050 [Solirubrobacterales bacterium]|nr:hypothetical protein [Solirubrobacterales bacterium]
MRKTFAILLATATMIAMLALPGGAAGQTPPGLVDVDIACTNPAGHQPPGQQPTCTGGAHEQETEVQNRAGHAPPGQNK